ncbi:MAG TPA: DUF2264 domain-containing protein [Lacunisphaera sp.]|jgi:hypothetical protein
MNTRRDFLKLTASAGLLGASLVRATEKSLSTSATPAASGHTGGEDRAEWTQMAARLATPLLSALSVRRLKSLMPVESHPTSHDRPNFTHLEGFGRLLAGLAPWFETGGGQPGEDKLRSELVVLARAGLDAATDPASPDFMNFSRGKQPLVDAAFLAQALRRAPVELWRKLEPRVQRNVILALQSSRVIQPGENNWKLFATTVEVFLQSIGEPRDEARLFEGIRKHRDWYVGDGIYGDGPEFHWDYYNSFVIQPMLVEALDVVGDEAPEWQAFREKARARLTRYAAIQERLIGPDGSYPVIGRSITYRCGAFHALALAALRHQLPGEVVPAQARTALSRVIRRTLGSPGTFDEKGWLQIGLAGHQPALGEPYISTGSLYLCSVVLLPLGLPPADPFWNAPAEKTTWEKIWSGEDLPADHALSSK